MLRKCAKTDHLQQCRISKFSGEDPRLRGGEGRGGRGGNRRVKGRVGKGRSEDVGEGRVGAEILTPNVKCIPLRRCLIVLANSLIVGFYTNSLKL